MPESFQIVSFYEFKPLGDSAALLALKPQVRQALVRNNVFGTIIIATEGFNASLCGTPSQVSNLLIEFEQLLDTIIEPKFSLHDIPPFRKQEVRIKTEIVTLKKQVDISLGAGTHVNAKEWNAIISDPDVYVLDTRNDYEFKSGTFRNAVNPETSKFSELPGFIGQHLDPVVHKKVAMFCTGGIRCEKFAPYMKERGFEKIYQLRGGILKYLEEVPKDEQLWEGECFVFDERITVNENLEKGATLDLSQRHPDSKSGPNSK